MGVTSKQRSTVRVPGVRARARVAVGLERVRRGRERERLAGKFGIDDGHQRRATLADPVEEDDATVEPARRWGKARIDDARVGQRLVRHLGWWGSRAGEEGGEQREENRSRRAHGELTPFRKLRAFEVRENHSSSWACRVAAPQKSGPGAGVRASLSVRCMTASPRSRQGVRASSSRTGMTPVGVSVVVLQRNAVLLAASVRAR